MLIQTAGQKALKIASIVLVCLVPTCPCIAADSEAKSLAMKELEQWILTEQSLTTTNQNWNAERERLTQTLELLKKRENLLQSALDEITVHQSHSDEQRMALLEEKRKLQQDAQSLSDTNTLIQSSLKALYPSLAMPLKQELKDTFNEYIFKPTSPITLTRQLSGLLTLLTEIERFDRTNSFRRNTRKLGDDNQEREIELIYLGLDFAIWVDRSHQFAGIGQRTIDGWVWIDRPELAVNIQRAIDIKLGRSNPELVELQLPLQNIFQFGSEQ